MFPDGSEPPRSHPPALKRTWPAYVRLHRPLCPAWARSSKLALPAQPTICRYLTQVGQQGTHSGAGMPGMDPVHSSRACSKLHQERSDCSDALRRQLNGGLLGAGLPPPQRVHVQILPAVIYFIFWSVPALISLLSGAHQCLQCLLLVS